MVCLVGEGKGSVENSLTIRCRSRMLGGFDDDDDDDSDHTICLIRSQLAIVWLENQLVSRSREVSISKARFDPVFKLDS